MYACMTVEALTHTSPVYICTFSCIITGGVLSISARYSHELLPCFLKIASELDSHRTHGGALEMELLIDMQYMYLRHGSPETVNPERAPGIKLNIYMQPAYLPGYGAASWRASNT
jgi:hypothetical protein